MKKVLPFILLLLFLLSSCISNKWVTNPYKEYDSENYVVALGYGETQEEADTNAKSELASLFGLHVTTVVTRAVTETLSDYDEVFMKASSQYSDVDNLYGINIAKRTLNKDSRYISLAVMEKKPTLQYLLGNIESEKKGIERLYSLSNNSLGSLEGLESASALVSAVRTYNTHIALINYLSGENYEYLDEKKALGKWKEVRESISINVSVVGDESESIASTISQILSSCGLRVVNNEETTSSVECFISMREVKGSGIASSFVFVDYDASIKLKDNQTNKIYLEYSLSGKEGHQNTTSAKTRALNDLKEKIETSFGKEIEEKFKTI